MGFDGRANCFLYVLSASMSLTFYFSILEISCVQHSDTSPFSKKKKKFSLLFSKFDLLFSLKNSKNTFENM